MPKGTARKRRKIREMKENLPYARPGAEVRCEECGRTTDHAEWCLVEDYIGHD